jgi:hypothetical protein
MRNSIILAVALIAGFSGATWTSQASAAAREAAVTECIAKAHKQYPKGYMDYGHSRVLVYKTCMRDAGFPP